LRLSQPNHPHNRIVEQALIVLRTRDEVLNIASQNLVEFWAVATRPETENGLGRSVEQAAAEMVSFEREWERLVATYRVSGKNTHDARLGAAMTVHSTGAIFDLQCA
jgi:hypothetical protein